MSISLSVLFFIIQEMFTSGFCMFSKIVVKICVATTPCFVFTSCIIYLTYHLSAYLIQSIYLHSNLFMYRFLSCCNTKGSIRWEKKERNIVILFCPLLIHCRVFIRVPGLMVDGRKTRVWAYTIEFKLTIFVQTVPPSSPQCSLRCTKLNGNEPANKQTNEEKKSIGMMIKYLGGYTK